jgi:hypothetical protein
MWFKDGRLKQATTPSRVECGTVTDLVPFKEEEDVEPSKPGESVDIEEETDFKAGMNESQRGWEMSWKNRGKTLKC